jgi:2,4-dienoyl-CoA reductase-like NADH-dependent reductase (Old Yellow Enzyme family)
MEDLQLVEGLTQNEISEENIRAFLELKAKAKELGFDFVEYDGYDGVFLVTFSIEN